MRAFLAKGGRVQRVPRGVSGIPDKYDHRNVPVAKLGPAKRNR